MDIQIKKWSDINIRNLAELSFNAIQNFGIKINTAKSVESLENWLSEQQFSDGSFVVVAQINSEIVGWLIVIQENQNKYTINPWGIHPFVSPDYNSEVVTSSLVECAVTTASERGATEMQFYVLHSMEPSNDIHESYKAIYNAQGLQEGGESVDMKFDLKDLESEDIEVPKGFEFVSTKQFDKDTLYSCYYDAFASEKLDTFIRQSDEERRAFFEELVSMGLDPEISLAIVKDGILIGFSFVTPYGETNYHITCICIHPDFARKGLGKSLLRRVQREAKNLNLETLTLYTDTDTRAYHLYIKNGWQVTETYTEYRWSQDGIN